MKWEVEGIPIVDAMYSVEVKLNVYGTYEGVEVPVASELALRGLIEASVRETAKTYRGTIMALLTKQADWSKVINQWMVEHPSSDVPYKGKVAVTSIQVPRTDAGFKVIRSHFGRAKPTDD